MASTKLPRIRFHDLRHSHATVMLKSNIHPKIVGERLGHSRVALTMDTSHVIPGMQEGAAAAIDAAFGTALDKSRRKFGSKAVARPVLLSAGLSA